MITFEYGAMSSRYSLQAENKFTAYIAMIVHFDSNNHLIALYEPFDIVKNDSWMSITGQVSERLDEIFSEFGGVDAYAENNIENIKASLKTIKQIV